MEVSRRTIWIAPNLVAALFLALVLSGGEGVKIRHLKIPDVVLNGTEQPVILDCDYVLDVPATTSGLVVKWFFNNHPAPVYQWIFNKKPQDLGVLKGKVNLNYKATNEESTMYRAIEIITPTTELSGEYKCLVSTFDKEDSRSKKMIVYVPEKSLDMTQEKPRDDRVTINCTAEGVFPEPNMTIQALDSTSNIGFSTVTTKKQNNSNLYDIKGSLTVDDVDLNSPTTFMCELSIPDAKYSNMRKLVYFPGPPTTQSTPIHPDFGETQPTSGASSSSTLPSFWSVILLSIIAAVSSIHL
ncbi:uncharacterized protein LOC129000052 isoform X1 [Macrosteles quadrilineatus]|uniref:uncharacterized protein LOC129000052 isoform X1 n=1 Tax=Macrosteles quadrilineatus TaxID=74068 RepID=UPI0023E107E4|nr:uncharacterized protein LOC129000052 isoform X1 [Macrosteles quadrilineatus]